MKLFTVGPVEMYENTLSIAGKQLPYFRTPEFSEIMFEIDDLIKEFLGTTSNSKTVYLTASGTGAMEAAVMNCFDKNDKLLVISGGSFGKRFEQICQIHYIPYEVINLPFGEKLTSAHLAEKNGKGFTGLLVNIHETSIGQLYPLQILSEFCKTNNMYFVVDAISSFLADYLDMDEYGIDAVIFSSQKALALAPGISAVVLSDRIYCEKVKHINSGSLYFNFNEYISDIKRGQTPFTPAVGVLLEMLDMLKLIKIIGLKNKIDYTHDLALDFRKKVTDAGFKIPEYPLSNALTPLIFDGNAQIIYQTLKDQYQIIVTPNGGSLKDILLRVGHIGNVTYEDHNNLIQALLKIKAK